MKNKLLIIPLLALFIGGCSTPLKAEAQKAVVNEPNLLTWLSKYDTNYTRDSQMHFTSDAYKKVSEKNRFPFTQSRKTLWIDNGLYMTTLSEKVNAGYYSVKENGVDQLYRYTLPGENPSLHINDTKVPQGFNSVKQTGYTTCVNDFFINMHKFHDNQAWADKFTLIHSDVDYFSSTDEEVFSDFMAFTASCYTNPSFENEEAIILPKQMKAITTSEGEQEIIETPFLQFKEARIYKENETDTLYLKLYVKDEYKDKLETSDGLFSVAKVYDANNTKIPVLDAYLNS